MTPQQINEAIAKACGYKNLRYDWINGSDAIKDWIHDDGIGIPNYAYSLDSMHSAEDMLSDKQVQSYVDQLCLVTDAKLSKNCNDYGINYWSVYHATAPQRAEAFLRTLNLWQSTPESK